MKSYLLRGKTGWRDTIASVTLGASVGAVVFYVARVMLSKRDVPQGPPDGWEEKGRLGASQPVRRLPGRKGAGGPDE